MIRIANAQVYVEDQDEALAFYTEKLGWEVRVDATVPEMNNFRWLTVGPAHQPDFALVLMRIPEGPPFEPETTEQVRNLTAKGAMSPIFLTTDDCHAAYEELTARGVEFVDTPEERPYGIDASFRDPSGNHIRLTQVSEVVAPRAARSARGRRRRPRTAGRNPPGPPGTRRRR